MIPISRRSQKRVARAVGISLLLAMQILALFWATPVSAASCPPGTNGNSHCYGRVDYFGQPGSFSGGATSIYVPTMTFNSPTDVLTNEMWIANFDNGTYWVEAGVLVGHSYAGSAQGQQVYFLGQWGVDNRWSQRNFGVVPPGDINQYANVYIFVCAPNQWCVVIESFTLGTLSAGSETLWPNSMPAEWQQLGEELSNEGNNDIQAYSDLALWANNRYRDNSGQYWPQARFGDGGANNDPPIASGWISSPGNGNSGTWYARTR